MKGILGIAGTALMVVMLVSCGETDAPKKQEQLSTTPVYKTMHVQAHQISGNLKLPGVMQPFEVVQIYPRVSGFVKQVAVDRGTLVRRGQVLLTLEAPEIEQQVAAAKLKYGQAEATYITSKDRYRRMKETSITPGTISPYDLEAAASKMQGDSATAQGEFANYKAQEAMRSYLTITAPFDGVITERNIHPGALASSNNQGAKPLLVLQQLSKLRLVVEVPEQYASQVRNGDRVHYRANGLPGKDFTGAIARSSQSLSSNYRSESIEVDVDNSEHLFKPGMYAEVSLPTSGNANAFVVPRSAIISTTERKYVIAVTDNKAKWVDISEGNQSNDSTEVFGNFASGDEIVVNGNYRIENGKSIR